MVEIHVDNARAAPVRQCHAQCLSAVSSDPFHVRLCGGEDDPTLFLQLRKDPRMGGCGRLNRHNLEAANDAREDLLDLRRQGTFLIPEGSCKGLVGHNLSVRSSDYALGLSSITHEVP